MIKAKQISVSNLSSLGAKLSQLYSCSSEGSMGGLATESFQKSYPEAAIHYCPSPGDALSRLNDTGKAAVIAVTNTSRNATISITPTQDALSNRNLSLNALVKLGSTQLTVKPMSLYVHADFSDDTLNKLIDMTGFSIRTHIDVIRIYHKVLTENLKIPEDTLKGNNNGTSFNLRAIATQKTPLPIIGIAISGLKLDNIIELLPLTNDNHVDSKTEFWLVQLPDRGKKRV